MKTFDVIVVGAGHAGVEAALSAARMGCKVLLLSMSADQIATMSCNPAVGGLGKSQIAKELDILGGSMARVADQSAMQYRVLNEKKGAAVRATRVQVDRHEYRERMKLIVESQAGLSLMQAQVQKLIFEKDRQISGVETNLGQRFHARAVVITTGTFMNGRAHVGKVNFASGRAGEGPSIGLSDFLRSLGIRLGRFKTGTVPRLHARSINWRVLEEQNTDPRSMGLSFFTQEIRSDLESAYLTYTKPETHEIIRANLRESPLYSGIIESTGPRYCPSVEDKVVRFADKERHQVFLEREGRRTQEVYVGGLSTSLPFEAQLKFLRSIPGLEFAEIIRPGYAIEYDFIDSTQLNLKLELKDFAGLFFAGQVNGTSGYEEAAGQGLWAGVNAACFVQDRESFSLSRNEAYLGVLVDDLTLKGTKEPYRMMSSRAEWRLLLREDNVFERLYQKACHFGLLSEDDQKRIEKKISKCKELEAFIEGRKVYPSEDLKSLMQSYEMTEIQSPSLLKDLIRRPQANQDFLRKVLSQDYNLFDDSDWLKVITEIRYAGYVRQAESQIQQVRRLENWTLPMDLDYSKIPGLARESVEKLSHSRPSTLGQAMRLEGVSPSSASILAIYLSRNSNLACANA
jgi:tRNA uridine 5-carboxymethylaminomethyl modification enzyme